MGLDEKLYYCDKCHRTMSADNFYRSNNLEKYPEDGIMNVCKNCLTMHIDNWDPETYKPVLEELDIPYIPEQWNKLLSRYGRNRRDVSGKTILGRYISTMRIKQYKDFRWKDTEFLQELADAKIKDTMRRQGYDAADIALAIEQGRTQMPPRPDEEPEEDEEETGNAVERWSQLPEASADDLGLTDEDVTYLRLKWGALYKPEEWVKMEQLYNDMMESYDIQAAGHIDTLKKICKASLKMDQLLDIGDVDGFQKVSKVYDSLMRSGKFTAAQNKAENGDYANAVSELVMICEQDGFIPRYYTDGPQDKADRVLEDLQNYTRRLISEDPHLGALIEKAVQDINADKQKAAEEEDVPEDEVWGSDEEFEEKIFAEDSTEFITEEDYNEFNDFEDEQEAADDEYLKKLLDTGEVF